MSPPINLYDIYRKVCNRKNSGSIEPGARLAAKIAADKAFELIEKVSPSTLTSFREAERKWASAAGTSKKSYADEFEAAIRSGNYIVRRTGVNNAWNESYQPPEGYIYGAESSERPGWIKLGATTEGPLDRIEAFRKRYGLKDIFLMYHAWVEKPMSVENAIRISLRDYGVRNSKNDSREWFNVTADHAMQTAKDAIVRLGVKVFTPVNASSRMKKFLEMKLRPVDYIPYGGRRVTGAQPIVSDVFSPKLGNSTFPKSVSSLMLSVNSKVFHKSRFGNGIVTDINQEFVTITFGTEKKQFPTQEVANYLKIVR